MAKPNKQVIIDFIVACLEKGEQRGKILVKAGKKWGTSKSAFDRLLKIAKEQHTVKQDAIKKKLQEIDEAAAIEARKLDVMTSYERMQMLTKIARGQIIITRTIPENEGDPVFENIIKPDSIDIKAAIAELNKMDGSYTPIKVANTDKNGEDVQPLSDTQVDKILSVIEKLS
ncbi:MAG: hypothetical protein ABFD79_02580 [Phycisphaerales bacterium]